MNQGSYIEETIRSILLQGYPDLEYFVFDGGSTDQTVDILRRYERWISFWVSEPDRGQAHAINKGLQRATGTLFNFINSDDFLLSNSLALIGDAHLAHPSHLVAGKVVELSHGSLKGAMGQSGLRLEPYLLRWWELEWSQPGIFYPTSLARRVGTFREEMHLSFDYEYICRCLAVTHACLVETPVAVYRVHPRAKTLTHGHYFSLEHVPILKHWKARFPHWDWRPGERVLAADLFRSAAYRLFRGWPEWPTFLWAALRLRPLWAVYSLLIHRLPNHFSRLTRDFAARLTS